jgi:integrase
MGRSWTVVTSCALPPHAWHEEKTGSSESGSPPPASQHSGHTCRRWSDLDLDAGRASIRQTVIAIRHTVMLGTPKTAKGRRTITLDGGTVSALREHRKRQAAERLLMGAGWTDNDLVFCHPDGTMLHPERFSRGFSEAVCRIGLPRIRLHDLRHGWATLALQAGIHPKVVQERLGTPTSGSRSTHTATSPPDCTRNRQSRSQRCFGRRLAIR